MGEDDIAGALGEGSGAGTAEGLGALASVGRETVQDRVYARLRESLIHGAFDAGDPFPAAEVAQRMGVSSMPVREALARLVSERALETTPGRRVRVPALSRARARDLASARLLIEGDLARRALPHLGAADLDRLEGLTEAYEAATDLPSLARLNHAFHFALYERAGSTVLLPVVESLWMQAGPYVRAAARVHSPLTDASATLHHRGILAAARARDEDALMVALAADVTRTFTILVRAATPWGEEAA